MREHATWLTEVGVRFGPSLVGGACGGVGNGAPFFRPLGLRVRRDGDGSRLIEDAGATHFLNDFGQYFSAN